MPQIVWQKFAVDAPLEHIYIAGRPENRDFEPGKNQKNQIAAVAFQFPGATALGLAVTMSDCLPPHEWVNDRDIYRVLRQMRKEGYGNGLAYRSWKDLSEVDLPPKYIAWVTETFDLYRECNYRFDESASNRFSQYRSLPDEDKSLWVVEERLWDLEKSVRDKELQLLQQFPVIERVKGHTIVEQMKACGLFRDDCDFPDYILAQLRPTAARQKAIVRQEDLALHERQRAIERYEIQEAVERYERQEAIKRQKAMNEQKPKQLEDLTAHERIQLAMKTMYLEPQPPKRKKGLPAPKKTKQITWKSKHSESGDLDGDG
ncbi:MAG: hypothetical protein Q9182_004136 [Xanthomendoza sp. 2 TL-2023]